MENKFDELCEKLMDKLGCDYNIKYYANTFTKWTDILTSTDKLIIGAMRVNNGQLYNFDDSFAQLDNIIINLMIPSEEDTFKNAISKIDNIMPTLMDYQFNIEDNLYSFSYQGRSEASKQTINGQQYALVTLTGVLFSYQKVVLSKSRKITINGHELKGILNSEFETAKTCDGDVYGLESAIHRNDINAVVVALTITIALYSNDDLHKELLKNSDKLKSYNISYNNGIVTKDYNMILSKAHESITTGDKLQAELSFIIA